MKKFEEYIYIPIFILTLIVGEIIFYTNVGFAFFVSQENIHKEIFQEESTLLKHTDIVYNEKLKKEDVNYIFKTDIESLIFKKNKDEKYENICRDLNKENLIYRITIPIINKKITFSHNDVLKNNIFISNKLSKKQNRNMGLFISFFMIFNIWVKLKIRKTLKIIFISNIFSSSFSLLLLLIIELALIKMFYIRYFVILTIYILFNILLLYIISKKPSAIEC